MACPIPYPLELVTPRLVIRSPSPEEAPAMRDAIVETLDDLKPWMPWAQHEPSLDEVREGCLRAVARFQNGEDFQVRCFLRDGGRFVGGSGLHRWDWAVPKCEIGYWVRRSCAGRGYVTEVVAELTRFALRDLGAERIEIRTSTRNVRSRRVPERLGFTLEGVLRNDARHLDGSLRDTAVYAATPATRPGDDDAARTFAACHGRLDQPRFAPTPSACR
jgi:RimJ/RimL family protein N-acetyltransferase